jgi:hypothetical protein
VVFLNSCLKVVFSVFFKRKTILNVPEFCHANSFFPPLALPPTKNQREAEFCPAPLGRKMAGLRGAKSYQ